MQIIWSLLLTRRVGIIGEMRSARSMHELCRCTSIMCTHSSKAPFSQEISPVRLPVSHGCKKMPLTIVRLDGLEARLARLENATVSLQQSSPQPVQMLDDARRSQSDRLGSAEGSNPLAGDNSTNNNNSYRHKRHRVTSPESQAPPPKVAICNPAHYAGEARELINQELNNNDSLPDSRRIILESALRFVSQVSSMPGMQPQTKECSSSETTTDTTAATALAPELMYMMLTGMHPS
jgi:hypothetical protein